MLGWPKRCKLAHAFLWEYSYKRLKLAQLLGQLGVFLAPGAAQALSPICPWPPSPLGVGQAVDVTRGRRWRSPCMESRR